MSNYFRFDHGFQNSGFKTALSFVENQLKELEGNHFALTLVEPSKFQQQDQHMVWQQQVTAIENSIFKLRQHQMKLANPEEE